MTSRIPDLTSTTAEAGRIWLGTLHKRGLLFCLDDKPEDIVLIANGEPSFTPEECTVLTRNINSLFTSIGALVHEIAFEILSETFHTAEERRAFTEMYG